MKTCTSCKIEKDLEDFPLDSSKPLGRRARCKPCETSARKLAKKRRSNLITFEKSKDKELIIYPESSLPARCDPNSLEMRRRRAAAEALYL